MDRALVINRILVDQLGIDESDIDPEKTLRDLGADSLDDVELIMAFEEEYDIEISDEEAESCTTVADIGTLLDKLIIINESER